MMAAKRKVERHPLDIPDFLKIPAKVRDKAWEDNPPRTKSFDMPTKTKNEDEATRLFREQVEREKELKKARAFEKIKRIRAEKAIDRTGQRWNPRRSRWEDDPFFVKPVHPGADMLVRKAEPKVKAKKASVNDGLNTFAKTTQAKPVKSPAKSKGGPIEKPCAAEVSALPEKGKRREVALAAFKGPASMAAIAMALGCSEGSVRSHLTDLHQKHGFGYKIEDGRATLLTPKGWKP